MWWNTHYTNGEAISHQFIMLLDPPKILPPGWAKKNGKSWANSQARGGGRFPCPNFFLKAKGEKTEKVGPIPKRGGGVPLSQPKKTQKMVNFHEKINCSEWSKMQNKHWNFFPFFLDQVTGRGGRGPPVGPKDQLFPVFFNGGSP